MKTSKILSAIFYSTIIVGATGSIAKAQDGLSWLNWGQPQLWEQPFDRSRAREWEKNPPRGYATLSKANLAPMKKAIKRYSAITKAGGWKPIPPLGKKKKLYAGVRSPSVEILRRRLEATGDLSQQSGYSHTYDYYVERAVKKFQVRHGLTPSGAVDSRTRNALNVPAKVRLRQLRINYNRLRGHIRSAAKRYVMVNIPAQQIEAVENGKVVSRHAAVVGKPDRRTPRLRSRIHQINFNPYWHLPASIVRKDMIPKARAEARRGRKDILERYKIHAYNGKGRKLDGKKINWFSPAVYNYRYRQEPWKDNSMGFVKINFHNAHDVYMHDTPSKSLFGRNLRANSSGCIRVQNVKTLVSWLVKHNKGWNRRRVDEMQENGKRLDLRLKKSVPVYFIYVTAWTNPKGLVNFRRDLYHKDGVGKLVASY